MAVFPVVVVVFEVDCDSDFDNWLSQGAGCVALPPSPFTHCVGFVVVMGT